MDAYNAVLQAVLQAVPPLVALLAAAAGRGPVGSSPLRLTDPVSAPGACLLQQRFDLDFALGMLGLFDDRLFAELNPGISNFHSRWCSLCPLYSNLNNLY